MKGIIDALREMHPESKVSIIITPNDDLVVRIKDHGGRLIVFRVDEVSGWENQLETRIGQ